VSFSLNTSANELFGFLLPAVLVLSASLSIWVLANARRRLFPDYLALIWALGTLFFPLIVFPLFLIAQAVAKRRRSMQLANLGASPRWRIVLPLVYGLVVFSFIGLYWYLDYVSVDAHLARAAQAKLRGQRSRSINEYRAALRVEDNPHTHKLLGIELVESAQWPEALGELRLAERGQEPDDSIPFRIATVLEALNQPSEAVKEYRQFLESKACTQSLPDRLCDVAKQHVAAAE
jgi:tetratricopeptide (TPR) repeat protein